MNQAKKTCGEHIKEALPIKDALLKLRQVSLMTGLSRSSVYALLKRGKFPEPVRLGKRCTRWRLPSIEGWINQAGN